MKNKNMKQNIWNTIRMYRWKSVFYKYFLSFFVLIIITLIPYNVLLYNAHKYTLSKEISTYSTANALKSKSIFDLLTSSFDMSYKLASDTDFVKEFLEDDSASDKHTSLQLTQNLINSMVSNSDFIDEIFIYSSTNNKYISSDVIETATKQNAWPWLNTYKATKFPFVMFPRKVDSEDFDYLFMCSEIYDDNENVIGVFAGRVKYENFVNVVKQSFQDEPDKMYIVSDIGLILYSNDPALINTLVFEHEDIYTAFQSAESLEGNTITFDNYIISVGKSSSNNLMLMSYFSKDFLMSGNSYIIQMIIICTISVFIIAIIIALFISLKQYKSVAQVMQTFDDPDKLEDNNQQMLTEFFYISNTISNMEQKNQAINDELSGKIRTLKKAQLAALQAQINPHFLFNTLQLINLSIIKETKRDTAATYLISQLSELLRASYDTDRYVVTFEEEFSNIQKYLGIQMARYKNRLEVTYDIDETCLSYKTLNLLLQPFVENAIVHGFKGKKSGWQIKISCYQKGQDIIYVIGDNGIGIEPIRLEQINKEIEMYKSTASRSIGITNVAQRLKLLYGNKCNINFSSNINEGTIVTIKHEINQNL